jgi:hypothetical protein
MLRPLRQIDSLNTAYVTPWTQERGGVLSYGSASGVTIVEYAANPSGAKVVGIQHNDVEHLNLTYEPHPSRVREVDTPCGTVGIIQQGVFETDWIHLIGSISSGDKAYAGPSGTITNSASFGGTQIGHFLGTLTGSPRLLTYRGLGFTRTAQEGGVIVTENDPNDRVFVQSDGFARVRIDQRTILRSQS